MTTIIITLTNDLNFEQTCESEKELGTILITLNKLGLQAKAIEFGQLMWPRVAAQSTPIGLGWHLSADGTKFFKV